jgi:hypothetical protein
MLRFRAIVETACDAGSTEIRSQVGKIASTGPRHPRSSEFGKDRTLKMSCYSGSRMWCRTFVRRGRRTKSERHVGKYLRPFWSVRIMRIRRRASAAVGQLRHVKRRSVMVPSTSAMLSGKVDLGMHNTLRMLLALCN